MSRSMTLDCDLFLQIKDKPTHEISKSHPIRCCFEKKFSNWEMQILKSLYFQIRYFILFNFASKIIAHLTLKFWNFPSDFGVSLKTKKNIYAVIYFSQTQFF